jgi:DNA/RNA endonuclease YhcR with UshA esterase domain
MRILPAIVVILLGAFVTQSPAQEGSTNSITAKAAVSREPLHLTAAEARDHTGAQAVVTGPIIEVNRTEKLTRLNFDHAFPNQTFTAVVFSGRTNAFPDLSKLEGKTIQVSGRVNDFHGRPEIILTETNQLKVVEKSDTAADK